MTPTAASRIVLLGPSRSESESKIRRYRLARLKLEGQLDRSEEQARYAHLKRVYD